MRKLMWFTLGFGGACALGSYVWQIQWAMIPAGIGLLLSLLLCRFQKGMAFRRMATFFLGFLLGTGWFTVYDLSYIQALRELDGKTVELELVSYKYSWETDYGSAVDCYLDLGGNTYRVRLYLNDKQEVEPWTTIKTPALLRLTTDGGRKEPTFHRSEGILALCYQKDSAEFRANEPGRREAALTAVEDLRLGILEILDRTFPDETAAFAKALLLGDRREISHALSTAFKVSGISHIVAVSGLHMSILFGLLYMVTQKRRWILAVLGIPVLCLFMALAGFSPSVTRAGIMQILIILALWINREYDPPTALAFSSLIMLVRNPLVASSVGFQLSVGSVAGIFLFYDPVASWISKRIPESKKKFWKRLRSWLISGIGLTISAQTVTAPLVALYFGAVSLIGIVTNLAVVWIVTFIFYGIMAVCLVGAVSVPLASLCAFPVSLLIRYVLFVARILAKIPVAAVYTESIYIILWLVFCYGLILYVIFGKDKRPLVSVLLGCMALCVAMFVSWMEPLLWDHCVTILDVGQGQSILLQHRGKTFVVDCGGDYPDDAADKCAEKLLSMGISRIDGLILTHTDADHAAGAEYLMERIRVDGLYLPQGAGLEGAPVCFVTDDLVLESEGMKITLFAPEIQQTGNESSIAVLFQTEKCDTLITGDMSGFWERMLMHRAELPDVELLVVGHHGAKDATCQELLDVTSPEIAVISVGQDNRYNHPHQSVLDRLKAAGCEIYRTDHSGDIIYRR